MGCDGSNVESVGGITSWSGPLDQGNDDSECGGWRVGVPPGGRCNGNIRYVANHGINLERQATTAVQVTCLPICKLFTAAEWITGSSMMMRW